MDHRFNGIVSLLDENGNPTYAKKRRLFSRTTTSTNSIGLNSTEQVVNEATQCRHAAPNNTNLCKGEDRISDYDIDKPYMDSSFSTEMAASVGSIPATEDIIVRRIPSVTVYITASHRFPVNTGEIVHQGIEVVGKDLTNINTSADNLMCVALRGRQPNYLSIHCIKTNVTKGHGPCVSEKSPKLCQIICPPVTDTNSKEDSFEICCAESLANDLQNPFVAKSVDSRLVASGSTEAPNSPLQPDKMLQTHYPLIDTAPTFGPSFITTFGSSDPGQHMPHMLTLGKGLSTTSLLAVKHSTHSIRDLPVEIERKRWTVMGDQVQASAINVKKQFEKANKVSAVDEVDTVASESSCSECPKMVTPPRKMSQKGISQKFVDNKAVQTSHRSKHRKHSYSRISTARVRSVSSVQANHTPNHLVLYQNSPYTVFFQTVPTERKNRPKSMNRRLLNHARVSQVHSSRSRTPSAMHYSVKSSRALQTLEHRRRRNLLVRPASQMMYAL